MRGHDEGGKKKWSDWRILWNEACICHCRYYTMAESISIHLYREKYMDMLYITLIVASIYLHIDTYIYIHVYVGAHNNP